ncbi:Twin-arginine translocation pathway signal [Falsiroseomonas bella]|uniref:Twin-arginine translocation pathway signal n=1 Tax=Falsiroseomonas bella TaxID=2184016 RepID=A0A317FBE8_9PROT|nr:tripartite tricarboxylate transporter substrate binding protein [Falsiroseomonas bella]PWS36410.1 Twin-arginine translocation pathway signal [Falsiroseomonas bella]
MATSHPTGLTRRRLSLAAGFGLAAAALPRMGAAQPRIPDGPVTIVVPFTPGTGPDILARLVAPVLQQKFGQPVAVDNRAGASGNIGSQAVARAAPDGRTLVMQPNTFVMNPSLFRQVPYDPVASFSPIAKLAVGDLVLVVNPDVPATDARAFAAWSAAQPGGANYASPGIGTPHHLAMELFRLTANVPMNHVPYRGSAPAIQDLIGKRVAAMVLPVHVAGPLARDGRIRILAVGSARRVESAPDVPTMAEAGYPDVLVDLWYALLGPAGLPDDFVGRVNADLNAWLAEPATRQQLLAQGLVPTPGTPADLAALIRRDLARWADVIRRAGISAD